MIHRTLLLIAALFVASSARAQHIDVSTLPPRASVQLTIYNAEDLTLVRERRAVTVREGLNVLQFSWAGTLIDPTSVQLSFRDGAEGAELVDTRFPHDRPQVLYWTVRSDRAGEVPVEISYFTSGISWRADYVGVAEPDERTMRFEGHVTVVNGSGEDYRDAEVRLVVGSINLVERIRELAERGIVRLDANEVQLGMRLKDMPAPARDAGRQALAERMEAGSGGMGGGAPGAPKAIVKEGLSEYFIFTVPGTETVPNGWSKRLRLFEGGSVPIKVVYRYRPEEYGDRLVRLYLVRNDEASELGESPLPDGAVRLFRRVDEGGGLAVTAFVTTKYVPIGQEFEFVLGVDPQVVFERFARRHWRSDFWFRTRDGQRLVAADGAERIRPDQQVSGWTDHEARVERIRNYRGEPIEIEWRLPIEGDVTMTQSFGATLHDYRSPRFVATVPAGAKRELEWTLSRRQGTNATQSAVTIP